MMIWLGSDTLTLIAPAPQLPEGGRVLDYGLDPIGVFSYTGSLDGAYRVEDAATEGYLLYRGVDAAADLTASAWETFSSFPHTSADLAAGHTYQFVLRKRNKWGLISQNLTAWSVTIDANGHQQSIAPQGPSDVAIAAAAAGTVEVTARYNWQADGVWAADTWLIYLRSNGTDPVPGSDTPITLAMNQADAVALLGYASSAFAEGADVRVIVRTRRTATAAAPGADSANSTVYRATATLLGPDAPEVSAFIGDQIEQTQ
jgi:hypothetical protein